MFEKHSKYFRNALVRANYQNLKKDITYTTEYLDKFFGRLLLDEKNLLDNKEMQININEEKSSQKSSQKILELIRKNPQITTIEMAEILSISRRAIAKQIASLKAENKLRRIGADNGGHWEII